MVQTLSPAGTSEERPAGATPEETALELEEGAETKEVREEAEEGAVEAPATYLAQAEGLWEEAPEEQRQEFLKSGFLTERSRDLRRRDFEELNRRYQTNRDALRGLRQEFQNEAQTILFKAAQDTGMDEATAAQAITRYMGYVWVGSLPQFQEAILRSEPFKGTQPYEWSFTPPEDLVPRRGPEAMHALTNSITEMLDAAYEKGREDKTAEAEELAKKKAKGLINAAEVKGRAAAKAGLGPRQTRPGGGSSDNLSTFSGIARAVAAGHLSQEEGRKRWTALETGG